MRNLKTKSLSPQEIEAAITLYAAQKHARIETAIKDYAKRKAAKDYAEKRKKDRELRFKERNAGTNECEMILGRNTQGKISVRCYCMSGFGYSKKYLNYETIGIATTEENALELWEAHVRKVKDSDSEPFEPFPAVCFVPCCGCDGLAHP